MKIKLIIGFGLLFWQATIFCQNTKIELVFSHSFDNRNVELSDSSFLNIHEDSLYIDVLKYYVSNIQFFKNNKIVHQEEGSYHLIDASIPETTRIQVEIPNGKTYDEVKFSLGLDSLTNVSGALSGDLDPTKGMYWTWQSGYIHFKLEGRSNRCNTRNNEFIFHLGGYQNQLATIQELSFRVRNQKTININLDIQKVLQQFNISEHNQIMSPSVQATSFAEIVGKSLNLK